MDNQVQNFSDFSYSLNEGNSYKKSFGILGPFSPWGYKIKACCPEKGGKISDSQMIVTDLHEGDENLCLKYKYGEGKESDPLYLPKGSFVIDGNPETPILQTRRHNKWWDDESNQDQMDDFVNAFIESKHFSIDTEEDVEGDMYSILEVLDLDSTVSNISKKKDLYWIISLDDGSEIEMKKRDRDNLFSLLKFYLNSDSRSPEVEIAHEKPGYEVIYNTPKGKFSRKCPNIGSLSSDPIHKYLFSSSMKKDPSLYTEPVLNYLNSILKGHDWRPQLKEKSEEFISSENEINQMKKILLNTLSESDLDEIYAKARERYSPSHPKQ
jgi:hypothetical protein